MRQYNIDYSDPVAAARTTIEMFRDQLIGYRTTTSKPEELEWEIRVYEFMLEDPLTRLQAYQAARAQPGWPKAKRAVVKELGWKIPAPTSAACEGKKDG